MSDIVYKNIYVLVHAMVFNCFQSAEIKENRGRFSDNYN